MYNVPFLYTCTYTYFYCLLLGSVPAGSVVPVCGCCQQHNQWREASTIAHHGEYLGRGPRIEGMGVTADVCTVEPLYNGADESVLISEVSAFLSLKCMQELYHT